MNLFDYLNFYYVISVSIIISVTLKTFSVKKKWKKPVSLLIGVIIAIGFGAVDYYFSQSEFSSGLQRLFLSFIVTVFLYDYTIKLIFDFINKEGKHESNHHVSN